jgi:hypothetical protein
MCDLLPFSRLPAIVCVAVCDILGEATMSIYFVKGSYLSPTCTVRVSSRSVKPILINTFPIAFEQDITFDGYLYRTPNVSNGVADLSNKMLALERAMAIPNEDVGIAYSGGITQHWLSTFGAIGGVYLKSFAFQDTPLHMATEVKWNATFSATYNNTALTRNLVQLEETTTIIGEGGAVDVLAPQAGLQSIYQRIADYSDVQVVQSGKVTGRVRPTLPSPLITLSGAKDPRMTRINESRVVRGLNVLLYVLEYQYTFNLPSFPVGGVAPTLLT